MSGKGSAPRYIETSSLMVLNPWVGAGGGGVRGVALSNMAYTGTCHWTGYEIPNHFTILLIFIMRFIM